MGNRFFCYPFLLKLNYVLNNYSAFAALASFHAATSARFAALMFHTNLKEAQDPIPMIAGNKIHIALIPKIAEAGCAVPAPAW